MTLLRRMLLVSCVVSVGMATAALACDACLQGDPGGDLACQIQPEGAMWCTNIPGGGCFIGGGDCCDTRICGYFDPCDCNPPHEPCCMADGADLATGFVFELNVNPDWPLMGPFSASIGGYKTIITKISDVTGLNPSQILWKGTFLTVAHAPVYDEGSSGLRVVGQSGIMVTRLLLNATTKESEVGVCTFTQGSTPVKIASLVLPTGEGTTFVSARLDGVPVVVAIERAQYQVSTLEASLPTLQAELAAEFEHYKTSPAFSLEQVATSGGCL